MNDKQPITIKILLVPITILLMMGTIIVFAIDKPARYEPYVYYEVDVKHQNLAFYWKNDQDQRIGSLGNLKQYVESRGEKLLFATNGGMYNFKNVPQGLFIQNGTIITPLDTSTGEGNFYLQPNGVFYTTTNKEARISTTPNFVYSPSIVNATQSGPILVVDGKINKVFNQESTNLHIRNGVGVLPNGKVIFAMSRKKVNFYDLASFFLSMGCENALYLDGFVSRTYLPEDNFMQLNGDFGVIIGVTS